MKQGDGEWMLAWFLCLPAVMYGQRSDFSGLKIFINPGHGGHDGDDEHMIMTKLLGVGGNLTKGALPARAAGSAMPPFTCRAPQTIPLMTLSYQS